MMQGPIFIGGPDRCGKTLMRLSLSAHPNIAMTRRTYMWTRVYNRWGDLERRENFERCLAAMLQHKAMAVLQPDAQRIRQEFWQGEPSYARLFALFHEHHAERLGKARWGDQLGSIERYADQIVAAYPNAKMIHMIRDPRDRFEIMKAAAAEGGGGVGSTTARWRTSVRLARRNLRLYPDCYLIVRYESLLSRREETLREVCEFIGERFVENMVTLEGAERFSEEPEHDDMETARRQAPEADVASPRELAFVQAFARDEMLSYGYKPRQLRMSLAEQLAFALVDWPANLARATAWHTLERWRANVQGLAKAGM